MPAAALCMTKQGHDHHTTQRRLCTQSPDAYGNTTVSGNVRHASQSCCRARGEAVLESRSGSVLMLAAQPHLGHPEFTTFSAYETVKNTIGVRWDPLRHLSGHVPYLTEWREVQGVHEGGEKVKQNPGG